ncbi:hypothetical protein L1049_002915 [Liquidambar formosana]|uniref:MADS-box domain-containing protein n=1 Tax=Liquidambar formosana TaxID=63359 RepID=A0AAP0NIG1_LIQFO
MALQRKSKGRQKIEMTKMSKESNLLVTFSKHRSSIFKKAGELSTFCEVEVAIIVFLSGKKVFSFSHPCVELAKMSKERKKVFSFGYPNGHNVKRKVKVAIIVFSSGKKVFSFGHPCVETIINRFFTRSPLINSSIENHLVEAHSLTCNSPKCLTNWKQRRSREEECGLLKQVKKASQTQCWWETLIEELGLQ